jgi:DNA excision repair protein ERCC-4
MYAESVEEHRYTEAIRRDKKAFEELSRKATNLVISFDDFTKDSSLSNEDISTSSNFSSTFSSSASANPRNNKIIIDIREFGSSLPSLIHRSGMKIDPVTLQVCYK